MKNNSTADISFEVGYKDDKTRFDLRMISVSEESELNQRLNDVADDDASKPEKEYRICLDALADFSHDTEDGAKLREKFSAVNLKSERIVRGAFNVFRNALAPEVSFL